MTCNPSRRASLPILVAFAALVGAASASADDGAGPEQLVWLKSGGFARGALLELVPADHVTLRLSTGEIRRFAFADIDRTQSAGPSNSSAVPPVTPPPAAPPSATPAPAPTLPASAASSATRPASAPIHLVTTEPRVVLEARPRLEKSAWIPLCPAPCDRPLGVVEHEFRVAGEGVSPSGTFVIEPGDRVVRLQVRAGSEWARRVGTTALLAGAPLTLLGGALYGAGHTGTFGGHDAASAAGLVTAIVGGVLVIGSLPFLWSGSTRVSNQQGDLVGASTPRSAAETYRF